MEYVKTIGKDNSVKQIKIIIEPKSDNSGIADVFFRNVYSVYDWGAMSMPEACAVDNSTLLLMASQNFENLQDMEINTHYIGVVDKAGNHRTLSDMLQAREMPVAMRIRFVNKLKPSFENGKYNYDVFQEPGTNNYVIPLEIIFRNELPPESSVWKRIRNKEITLADLGLPGNLQSGDVLPNPILDFSTKYEPKDRYLSAEDARHIAVLSLDLWNGLTESAKRVNNFLTEKAESLGFTHPDGKVEFIRDDLKIYLADVAGTWHEDRFSYGGQKISKQLMRDAHKIQDREWCEQCDDAPKKAEEQEIENWKTLVTVKPAPLEPEFFEVYNTLTKAATNKWLGVEVYDGLSLEKAIEQFREYWQDFTNRKKVS